MRCNDVEHLIARAGDAASLTAEERARLDEHLKACSECRAALDDQRHVARLLHARVESPVRAGFSARVAARLDARDESESVLDLANWRAWTVGLAPVAAALILMAWLGVGARQTTSTSTVSAPFTFMDALPSATNTRAAVFLQPAGSSDALLEAVLTGTPPSSGETNDVR